MKNSRYSSLTKMYCHAHDEIFRKITSLRILISNLRSALAACNQFSAAWLHCWLKRSSSWNQIRIDFWNFWNFRGHSICQVVILNWVTDRIWIIESVPSTSTGLEVWYLSKQSYSNLILKHALIPPPRYTDISIGGGGKSHHWDISVYSSDFTGRVF